MNAYQNVRNYRRVLFYRCIRQYVIFRCQRRVIAGPFAGLAFPNEVRTSVLPAYLTGLYERELHGCLNQLSAFGIKRVVNVGAADGYYAVGLALLLPGIDVIAFEANSDARKTIDALAAHNRVADRVRVHGHCGPQEFDMALRESQHRALIFMDIEGGENGLLRVDRCEELRRAIVIVETHDFVTQDGSKRIAEEFAATHMIESHPSVVREPSNLPRRFSRFLTKRTLHVCSDQRGSPGQQSWLFLKPVNHGVGSSAES